MPNDTWPEWEQVLSSAARLQRILPEAVLVGGTAAALYAEHRLSIDADHMLADLRHRFDTVLAELEVVAGEDRSSSASGTDSWQLGRHRNRDTAIHPAGAAGNHADRLLRRVRDRTDDGGDVANQGRVDPEAQCDPRLS